MNRANVIGPSRSISSRILATSSSSWPTASRSGSGIASDARASRPSSRRAAARPTTSRTPGPTSVCPPSRIGIRAAAADAVSSRSHGSPIAIGEQQVRGEAVLGRRPARTRRRRAGGQAGRACRGSPRRRTGPGASRAIRGRRDRAGVPRIEAGRRGVALLAPAAARPGRGAMPPAGRAPRPTPGPAPRRGARASRASSPRSGRPPAAPRADRPRPRGRPRVDPRPWPSSRRRRSSPPAGKPMRTRSSGPSRSNASRQRRRRSSTR